MGLTVVVRKLLGDRQAALGSDVPQLCADLLWRAAYNGQVGVARLLLQSGAAVNVTTNGCTPLFIAAQSGQAGATRLLLAHGAAANWGRDKDGCTHTPLARK